MRISETVPVARRHGLAHDLVLPTLLFVTLGGMTWAVRGCSGFGAVAGCVFAGVTWGAAWWYLAQGEPGESPRRYRSGWIVLAMTVGVGLSGARGWMQWPSFFEGKLVTDAATGLSVPIPRAYGFLWLFLAGVPWAGIGACLLAWTGSIRETRFWHWALRIGLGLGGGALARYVFDAHPSWFLPLYGSLESRYHDLAANPSLRRLVNDCGAAIVHLGIYLGFLIYEAIRREGKNVVLIVSVGLLNGLGWAACQNWKWAKVAWPGSDFNFWRCWESSGGISIGLALGVAYFLVNRPMGEQELARMEARPSHSGPSWEWFLTFTGLAWVFSRFFGPQFGSWGSVFTTPVMVFAVVYYLARRDPSVGPFRSNRGPGTWDARLLFPLSYPILISIFPDRLGRSSPTGFLFLLVIAVLRRTDLAAERQAVTPPGGDPILERLGLHLGLLLGLGLSIRNGLKGWFNIYLGNEDYWSRRLWDVCGPIFAIILVGLLARVLIRPGRPSRPDSHAYRTLWLVLIVQNLIAQLITGPLSQWNEMAFSLYYVLLFLITATIVFHYHTARERPLFSLSSKPG